MFSRSTTLAQSDPELWQAISAENRRQEEHIELIASENYASPAVMAAQGTQLTNKYAEGYPGRRYYGGCEHVDVVEQLAIDRVRRLFHAEAANVQPHSGAQANQAVFFAALAPGDTILGMSLPHGGHLTHGSPVNMSGKWFRVVAYGLDPETEFIDYAEAERLAREHKPKLIMPARRPTRASSNGSAFAPSPTRSAHCSWSIWRTMPASSRQGFIRARSASPISSRAPRTRRCAALAAASS